MSRVCRRVRFEMHCGMLVILLFFRVNCRRVVEKLTSSGGNVPHVLWLRSSDPSLEGPASKSSYSSILILMRVSIPFSFGGRDQDFWQKMSGPDTVWTKNSPTSHRYLYHNSRIENQKIFIQYGRGCCLPTSSYDGPTPATSAHAITNSSRHRLEQRQRW